MKKYMVKYNSQKVECCGKIISKGSIYKQLTEKREVTDSADGPGICKDASSGVYCWVLGREKECMWEFDVGDLDDCLWT